MGHPPVLVEFIRDVFLTCLLCVLFFLFLVPVGWLLSCGDLFLTLWGTSKHLTHVKIRKKIHDDYKPLCVSLFLFCVRNVGLVEKCSQSLISLEHVQVVRYAMRLYFSAKAINAIRCDCIFSSLGKAALFNAY